MQEMHPIQVSVYVGDWVIGLKRKIQLTYSYTHLLIHHKKAAFMAAFLWLERATGFEPATFSLGS